MPRTGSVVTFLQQFARNRRTEAVAVGRDALSPLGQRFAVMREDRRVC